MPADSRNPKDPPAAAALYADDFSVGFQRRTDAERFLADLRDRLAGFDLTLHPEKTRLIEFGRFARQDREHRGKGKPETFDLLGFTHICEKPRRDRFKVQRKTMRNRLGAVGPPSSCPLDVHDWRPGS